MDIGEARRQIEGLIFQYAEALDSGDLEMVSGLFEKGCIRVDGQPAAVEGKEQIKKMFATFTTFYDHLGKKIDPVSVPGKPFTRHITSNLWFESIEDARARTRSCFTVLQALPGQEMKPIISGRYVDTFGLEGERWHFLERFEYLDLFGDLSQHLNDLSF